MSQSKYQYPLKLCVSGCNIASSSSKGASLEVDEKKQKVINNITPIHILNIINVSHLLELYLLLYNVPNHQRSRIKLVLRDRQNIMDSFWIEKTKLRQILSKAQNSGYNRKCSSLWVSGPI